MAAHDNVEGLLSESELPSQPPRTAPSANTVLWTLAVVFAGTNVAFSLAGKTVVAVVSGAALLTCLLTLLVRYLNSVRTNRTPR